MILDGEIVIGEAKSNSRLRAGRKGTAKAAQDLVRVAQLLSADQIVLATAMPAWAPGVLAAVEHAIATEWRIGPAPRVVEETSMITPPS